MNVKRGILDWSGGEAKRWPDADPGLAEYALRLGDIVIAMDGLVGRSNARITEADLPAYLVQRVARLRAEAMTDQSFLYHLVASASFARHCWSRKTGTTISHISKADIEEFEIPRFGLPAEQRLGRLLDLAERAQQLTDALIAAKREQKRGLMQQLLTGKVRFPGFTEPWKTVPLKSMITLDSPGAWGDAPTHADPGVVVLRSTNITDDGRIDLTSTVNRSLEPRKRAALSIRSGDILLERSGGTDTRPVGRVAFARMDIDACYSNFLQRLRPDRTAVSPFFLFLQLMQLHASGATNRLQAQTTGIRNLMYRAYLECSLPLPKLEEQVRICDALDAATSEIELLVNQREAFATQRRGLMERLLSGEIDIPSSDTSAA